MGDALQTLSDAEESGRTFARIMGVSLVSELRGLPAEYIQMGLPGQSSDEFDPSTMPSGLFESAWPIVDGKFLAECPASVFSRGAQNDVPLLTGSNENEGAIVPHAKSASEFVQTVRREFGSTGEACLECYRATTGEQAAESSAALFADRSFGWHNWTWARLQRQTGRANAYLYRFSRASPIPSDAEYCEAEANKFGAFHCAEIPYVFRTLDVRNWPWQAQDHQLSETMSSFWINFASSGNPNGPGLPSWPIFNERTESIMRFGDEIKTVTLPDVDRFTFLEAYYNKVIGRSPLRSTHASRGMPGKTA